MTDGNGFGDSITEVTTQGWGSRIGGSLLGALFGIVMVVGSVVLLYWNEGRAVAAIGALDQAARQVVEVRAAAVDPAADGRLVHLTGMMQTAAAARDPVLGVGGEALLRLRREVEMFQWREEKSEQTEKSLGGSERKVTTYSYRKEWSSRAIDSSRFRDPERHPNPPLPIASTTIEAGDVHLGAYRVDPGVLANLTAFRPLPPQTAPDGYRQAGDRLYRGQDPDRPAVGDVRIAFEAVPAQTVSVVAAQAGGALTPYRGAGGYEIALATPGAAAAAAMFREKKHQEGILTWIVRGVGFVVMLVGFCLIGGPLAALAAVLPFLEGIVGAGVFLVALTLALPLALVTIAVAWFAHRPLVGAGLVLVAVLAAVGLRRLRRAPPRRPAPAG